MNRFLRVLTGQSFRTQDDPHFYNYQSGILFDSGAERMALERKFSDPIDDRIKGAGFYAGMLPVIAQAPQVVQNLALPVQGLWGFPVGAYSFQSLAEQAPQ